MSAEAEEWRPAPGFEGIYEVSSHARVRRILPASGATPGRILKPFVGANGRIYITIRRDGAYKSCILHRLVAGAFVPNPDGKPEVNHIDGNPANNLPANLEWVTRAENQDHAQRVLKRWTRQNSRIAKLTHEDARLIREEYNLGSCGGYRGLGRKYGVSHAAIRCVIKGRTWKSA